MSAFVEGFTRGIAEWFTMGGYGWYVWPSYLAGLVILTLNLWLPLRRHRRLLERESRPPTSQV